MSTILHREHRLALGRADEDQIAKRRGAADHPPMGNLAGIPPSDAPDFLSRLGVVGGDAVAADEKDLVVTAVFIWNRRTVTFLAFLDGVVGPNDPPDVLPGLRINGEQERVRGRPFVAAAEGRNVALEYLDVQLVLVEQR